jgi:hypothetical protein
MFLFRAARQLRYEHTVAEVDAIEDADREVDWALWPRSEVT